VKWFGLYTLARLGVFAATFGIVWLIAQFWLDWNLTTGLWTALVALAVSAPTSFIVLSGLRNRTAVEISERASRARAAFEQRRSAEDVDDPAEPGAAAAEPGSAADNESDR
jgi:membrane glycosyltransferase